MNTEELFINSQDLPNTLSKKEFLELYQRFKNGDLTARDEIICHNIRLVISRVLTRFGTVSCDKKELVSIGCHGLLQAINNFDLNRNVEFSTYAVWCIDSKILQYIKKLYRLNNHESFEEITDSKISGQNSFGLENKDLIDNLINEEISLMIKKLVYSLPKREHEIVTMYFGFLDDEFYKQDEIAKKFNITQAYVSILIKRVINQIADELVSHKLIEKSSVKSKKY